MLKDRIYNYYMKLDYNCAEALLLAANDEYRLGIAPDDFKLIGGFGGGMGCKHICGALCSAVAVLGKLYISGRAHTTKSIALLSAICVGRVQEQLGTDNCAALRERFFAEETRCLDTVYQVADVLEGILRDYEDGTLFADGA